MELFCSDLGFDDIGKSICEEKSIKIFVILGDYKQGKTSALKAVGDYISSHKIIIGTKINLALNSDPTLGAEDYFPFISYIATNESLAFSKTKARARILFSSINKATKTIDKLINVKSAYSSIYTSVEISLLEDLEKITSKGASIFLCDDVDKWDWSSISFLKKLIAEHHNRWIKNSTFILTATNKEEIDALFPNDKYKFTKFILRNLSKSSVERYLASIKSNIQLEELYEITSGNLGETCEFIRYFERVGDTTIFKNLQVELNNKIKEQVKQLSSLEIEDQSLNDEKETKSTISMINRSSIIGEHFHRAILQELTHAEDSFARYLTYALKSGIYGQRQKDIYFVYSTVYKRLNAYNKNNSQYHLLLANALQKIVPSNYRLRAKELILSNYNDNRAAISYFNYAINHLRKYQKPNMIDIFYVDLLSEQGLFTALKQLQDAYLHYYQGDYDEANNNLPNRVFEPEINFQIDYLRCLILVNKNVLTSDYSEAGKILLPWVRSKELKNEEPYLWIQGAILYDEIMSEIESQTEPNPEILNIFNKFLQNDLEFRIEYYDYQSKNNYTYKIDVQYIQTNEAVEFFRANTWIPGKSLFARALSNHIANAMVLGKYDEALKLSQEYFQLLSEYSEVKNYLFTVLNNYFVALIMRDERQMENASIFAYYYEKILTQIKSDKISETLLKINYGLMLFLANKDHEAMTVYTKLYDEICSEKDVDDYYRYYVINNYKLISGYLNGDLMSISFNDLENLNPYPTNSQFFNKHTERLKTMTISNPSKKDLFIPMGTNILGPAWTFWGRPLLFTDIQYWSD